jgi:hypothetical protein
MSTNDAYEKELEAEEQKHKKLIKYDVELIVIALVIVAFTTIVNLYLKSEYKGISEIRPDLAPAVIECNKSILNAAETYRKGVTDTTLRVAVDETKLAFDRSILYYGKVVKKGTDETTLLTAVDSCYFSAVRFRTALRTSKELKEAGVTDLQLTAVDNAITALHQKIDTLADAVAGYNKAGFLLKFSWLTPYPGTIEHSHAPLPDLEPMSALPPKQ